MLNNPIKVIDPNGMEATTDATNENGEEEWDSISYSVKETAVALNKMWALSNSGENEADVKEVSAYVVIDKKGIISIIVFNPKVAGNTATHSNNPDVQTTEKGKCVFYKGRKVLAQVHTHPQYVDNAGNVLGGLRTQGDLDIKTSAKLKAPVFSIGSYDMEMTYYKFKKEQHLKHKFRESIMNNDGPRLIRYIKTIWDPPKRTMRKTK